MTELAVLKLVEASEDWELVAAHKSGGFENSTHRLKIPEGWLYRYGSQLVFVPARHEGGGAFGSFGIPVAPGAV